jgi:toxin ParE1/3/4
LDLQKELSGRALSLERFPARGRVVPELQRLGIQFLRELIFSPYRLLYRIERQTVHVLVVFDGRRSLDDLLLDRALRDLSGEG